MKAIYLNNFRGFLETIIPIEQMNFLVGENSTGKSSLLNIINILSKPGFFWINPKLSNKENDLGNFEDMISAEGVNDKDFTIGYLFEHKSKNKDAELSSLIVTYSKVREKTTPILASYSNSEDCTLVTIKINGKRVSYSIKAQKKETVPIAFFKNIIKNHNVETHNFTLLNMEETGEFFPFNDMPFIILRDLIKKQSPLLQNNNEKFRVRMNDTSKAVWIAPIREQPERIYDNIKPDFSPSGLHTPHLLNEILNKKDKNSSELKKALKSFGKNSGLFKDIKPKRFGKGEGAPFEIDVTLSSKPIKITNVGYGIAQILPVIVESFVRSKGSTFCIQQPEVHLHPKAQAALGEFFYDFAKDESKSFLIETHSDFLIDRYRIALAKNKDKISSQVLYFERKNGFNTVHSVLIDEDGRYAKNQPKSFRDFFLNEQIELLSI